MRKKLAFVVEGVKNPILTKLYEKDAYDWSQMLDEYKGYAKELDPHIRDTFPIIQDALDRKANILLEGAQATMLDIDFGTYPYVTSSNTTAGGGLTGSGIPPTRVDLTIGVFKAYTSRVGYGPFPSELLDEVGDQIRERGHEFGTVAGRDRRGELLGRPAATVLRLHRADRGADRRARSARGHRSAPRPVRHPRPAALRLISELGQALVVEKLVVKLLRTRSRSS